MSDTDASLPDDDVDSDNQTGNDVGAFEPEQEDSSDDSGVAFSPMAFSQSLRRISDLFGSKNDHELDTTPPFQRGYVWDKGRASLLIESVLLGVPLPIVYTAEDSDGREVVIDGQQRLITFFSFLENRWPRDQTPFRLRKLKILKDLKGKSFTDLPIDLQRKFRRYGINVVRISSESDENVKFEIFERLNTGAVMLSPQELRNCLYRGPLNDKLKELASYENFQRSLGVASVRERMQDVELVLRARLKTPLVRLAWGWQTLVNVEAITSPAADRHREADQALSE